METSTGKDGPIFTAMYVHYGCTICFMKSNRE